MLNGQVLWHEEPALAQQVGALARHVDAGSKARLSAPPAACISLVLASCMLPPSRLSAVPLFSTRTHTHAAGAVVQRVFVDVCVVTCACAGGVCMCGGRVLA